MTAFPLDTTQPEKTPRPSARIARVAAILDCDPSDVRRMVREGTLKAHRKGVRGIRVYLDSVATYQQAKDIEPELQKGRQTQKKRATVSKARTTASLALLRQAGIVR